MRLDADTSRQTQSPPQTFRNGASKSSAPRSPTSKAQNGDSQAHSESNDSHASGGPVWNAQSMPATLFGHDREEVTRILIQSLTDLGYHGAAGALCQESGFQLEGPTVASFRTCVLNGDWTEAEELLFGTNTHDSGGGIGLDGSYGKSWDKSKSRPTSQSMRGLMLAESANRDDMLFWMKRQKYLELLERREVAEALTVLRQELTPLRQDVGRLHTLSGLMMCQSAEDVRHQADWDGARGQSRTHLLSELSKSISPSIMIPEHRLSILLNEIKDSWIANCLYHNTVASPSLYLDHNCAREDFPTQAFHDLSYHKDEVLFLRFSHDGTKLASTSKDATVIIYETETYQVLHHLKDHQGSAVAHLDWSPDSTKIVTCCMQPENSARIWNVRTGACIRCISDFTYPCTTAAWTPSGKHVVLGSQDDKIGCGVWDLEGQLVHNFCDDEFKIRVNDLAISPDGQRLVVVSVSSMTVFNFDSYEKICEWPSVDKVQLSSVVISQDSRHMLVSTNQGVIKLMEIDSGKIIQMFEGHQQKDYIIRSAFGGADENFVVSGSEDSHIYIWRLNGVIIEALEAHPGCVNSIAWHPRDPAVFASGGDDTKVRIWKPINASPMRSGSGARPSSLYG